MWDGRRGLRVDEGEGKKGVGSSIVVGMGRKF